MRKSSFLVLAAMLASATAADAQVRQLTFEGVGNGVAIGSFYNGGAGGALNVTFGGSANGLVAASAGGSGNFEGNPSGNSIMYWTTSNPFMNVSDGFTDGFSLFYSAITQGGSVSIFDGLNGTGNLLGSINLPITPAGPYDEATGCSGGYSYCPWVQAGTTISGTAYSVVFDGGANGIGFDNVTFGSATAETVETTPEPASFVLLATGLVGIGAAVRRRKQA